MFEFPPGFPYRTDAYSPEITPPVSPDLEDKWDQIIAEVEVLTQQGKTNGIREVVPDQDPTTMHIYRYWADEQSANNWVGYVNTIELPIYSITVETAPQ